MSNGGLRASVLLAAIALVALAMPIAAGADEGDGSGSQAEARVELSCSANSRVRLRVRTQDDDMLRIDLDLRTPRRGASWLVVMVHERRLVFRVPRRTGRSSGSLSLRRTIPDWPGPDTVTVRATGPRGEVCRASATIDGD
ncbi:MAG TPA: hypothetical protein VHH57_10255 [Gaiella sp.]|jgi:hypothetical protein|nr:hypothetical protein [Gaiella sp.]